MSILVTCQCGQEFQTKDENAGRRAKCPDCGRELIVPKPGALPGDELIPVEPGPTTTSGKAIASFCLGLCSFFCTVITGVPAIILGALGLGDINRSKGRVGGSTMAIVGIITGGIGSTFVFIAVLIALLLPAVQAAREAARRAQCVNNLKQIGLAMHNYHSTNDCFPDNAIRDAAGRPLLSWRVAILPYIEQGTLYNKFKLDEPWDSPHNIALLAEMPNTYRCPSTPTPVPPTGQTSYQVFVGPGTLFNGTKPSQIQNVTDGTSNTIMVAEAAKPVAWTAPDDIVFDPTIPNFGLGSLHPGGVNSLFADGSVRFLRTSVQPSVLSALITRDGGEVVPADAF